MPLDIRRRSLAAALGAAAVGGLAATKKAAAAAGLPPFSFGQFKASVPLGSRLTVQGDTLGLDISNFQRSGRRYHIMSHRGPGQLGIGAAFGPESTLAGFALAAAAGGDWMETDIAVDSQGVPWCFHDTTVDRTTNGTGTIANLTTAYIAGLDAGSKYSARFAGEPPCSLDTYFKFCSTRNLMAIPEAKTLRSQADLAILINTMRAYNWGKCTYWNSANLSDLQYIRNVLGEKDCGLHWSGVDVGTTAGKAALAPFAALSGRKLFCFASDYPPSADRVQYLQSLGIEATYAMATGIEIPAMMAMGIRIFYTDGAPGVIF